MAEFILYFHILPALCKITSKGDEEKRLEHVKGNECACAQRMLETKMYNMQHKQLISASGNDQKIGGNSYILLRLFDFAPLRKF